METGLRAEPSTQPLTPSLSQYLQGSDINPIAGFYQCTHSFDKIWRRVRVAWMVSPPPT